MKRRNFLQLLTIGSGLASTSALGQLPNATEAAFNNRDIFGQFTHGVASGDPLHNAVILWTRFIPDSSLNLTQAAVKWEVATNKSFTKNYKSGTAIADSKNDYIVKVDAKGLSANKIYYYRFSVGVIKTIIGKTRTLPKDKNVKEVRFAIATCANHPAGYFNVYKQINAEHKRNPYDALLHIGDYIYEYGMGEYASENAVALDRVPSPAHECITLTDYRKRYSQYRSDPDLQALHAQLPFINIWAHVELGERG